MAKHTDCTDLWRAVQVLEVSNALKGKSFSITGHLGLNRDEIVRIIQTAGGHYEPRPRRGVHFLITNFDWNRGSTVQLHKSSKVLEAERNGIKVLSEEQFCQLVIDGGETMADTMAAHGT